MMKFKHIIVCTLLLAGCGSSKVSTTPTRDLDGTWSPIKQEMGGMSLPLASFERQVLSIRDSSYNFVAESVDNGVLRYGEGKMDIYGKEGVNRGKHFSATYKLEDSLLTICYNLQGNSYPTLFETKGRPTYFLSVFKKSQ